MSVTKAQLIGNVSGGAVFSGDVGIGTTTSPTTALDVNGDVTITDKIIHGGDTDTAIRFPAADTVSIETAGSERARIDSGGRLLVGVSTAGGTELIQVQGVSGSSTAPGGIALRRSSLGNTDDIGFIAFTNATGNVHAQIRAFCDGTPGASDYPGALLFSTTADGASVPTERMRITSGGSVGIGVAPDSTHRVTIAGADNTSGNYALVVRNSVGANLFYLRNDSHFFADSIFNQTTAAGANVSIDGAARLLRSTSSLKYKTNVETLEDSYADAILNVRPVWYQSLGANDNPDWGWWGFIAEEVAEVDPRLVSWKTTEVVEDENGSPLEQPLETPEPEGVHYDRFVPHLLNLIKRQQQAIETLEAKVAALEGV